jgi:hypothetical protein
VFNAIQPTQYAIRQIRVKTPSQVRVAQPVLSQLRLSPAQDSFSAFNASLFPRLMMLEESEKNDDRNWHS